ncbi:MAG: AMP-binding protein [Clostridiaceae bacterium]|nr:AMP-binding protein [Clostridiaceae bacterium]
MKKEKLYTVRQIQDLKDMLEQSVPLYGNNPAFRKKDSDGKIRTITYNTFYNDITALGAALIDMGLKNKKVAVLGENRYLWCVTYLSVVNGVGTIVPLDRELPVSDIENLLQQSQATAIVFSEKYLEMVQTIRERNPEVKHWICMDDTDEPFILSLAALIADGRKSLNAGSQTYQNAEIDPDSPLILLFTSGTTGFSKGVMLSHKNICSVITGVSATVRVLPEDTLLSILPLHHTYECTLGFLTIIYSGASIAFSDGLKYIPKNMKEYQPTILVTVPLLLENVYNKVWAQAEKQKGMKSSLVLGQMISGFLYNVLGVDIRKKLFSKIHDNVGGKLRLFIVGAAAIDPKVSKGLRKWGFSVLQGYGLTECAPLVTGNRDLFFKDDSAGIAIPGVEIKIDNPDKKGIGEILVRGSNVMLGYFNNLKETEKVITGDWFHTGDLGRIDRKGFLYITGRCKNVIVTKNGKNIFPEELENYIKDSPFVGECIVYGEFDENSGETKVKAQIFPNLERIHERLKNINLSIDTEEIRKLIQEVINNVNRKNPLYKQIRHFIIRDSEFEKTTSRKIKRHSPCISAKVNDNTT